MLKRKRFGVLTQSSLVDQTSELLIVPRPLIWVYKKIAMPTKPPKSLEPLCYYDIISKNLVNRPESFLPGIVQVVHSYEDRLGFRRSLSWKTG